MTMLSPEQHEAAIRAARTFSNKSIARRNLTSVAESLAADYVGVIGDGTFVTRAEYLHLYKQGFDAPRSALSYERIADKVEAAAPLAAETGHWIATATDGSTPYTGTYMAMWRLDGDTWKIRTELFVTLTATE